MAIHNNNANDPMKPCSVRLPQGLLVQLQDDAARTGTSLGDVIRRACVSARESHQFDQRFAQLESRLFRRLIEAQCIIAGLTPSERQEAIAAIKLRLQQEAKS